MVHHITYKGKKLPIKIGYMALKALKAKTQKSLADISSDDLEVYEVILFYALKQGAYEENIAFTWKEEDMEYILDDCFFDFVAKIPLFFPDAKKAMAPNQKTGK